MSTIQKKETLPKWQDFNCLHPHLIHNLSSNGLKNPTSIQKEVFENYKHFYDFLVASQTGSGKTLAFAAPIISDLLQISDNLPNKILCLVLTPTRELAQQIQNVISTAIEGTSIIQTSVLGGLSMAKQTRVIQEKKPHIIVGTPGRISEMVNQEIINFSNLKYLVIDQADRMIQMGHYVELDGILHKIFNPHIKQTYQDDLQDIMQNLSRNKGDDGSFYIYQNGKKKKVSMNIHSLSTDKLFELPSDMFEIVGEEPKFKPKKNKKKIEKKQDKIRQKKSAEDSLSPQQLEVLSKMKRKVFFISATLTREFKGTKYSKKKNKEEQQSKKKDRSKNKDKSKNKDRNQEESEYTPKLKALLSRIKFDSKPKIIDQSAQLFLPKKLTELYCFCDSEQEKIATLICYLRDLPKDSKAIVFANTIKSSKRVQFFLQNAGIKCCSLHSHMIQKQRLIKLEKFQKSHEAVLVSTDVAARGLDFIITHVIQYSVPVNGDTYVHRAGRTARANRSGEAVILISKKQANKWEQISSIISGEGQTRKIERYCPMKQKMNAINEQVEQYEWIRLNQQKQQNKRIAKLNEMEAQEFGFEIEEEHVKKNYLGEQQERIRNNKIKNKIKSIQRETKQKRMQPNVMQQIGDGKVWKKNKLVMSMDEIKRML